MTAREAKCERAGSVQSAPGPAGPRGSAGTPDQAQGACLQPDPAFHTRKDCPLLQPPRRWSQPAWRPGLRSRGDTGSSGTFPAGCGFLVTGCSRHRSEEGLVIKRGLARTEKKTPHLYGVTCPIHTAIRLWRAPLVTARTCPKIGTELEDPYWRTMGRPVTSLSSGRRRAPQYPRACGDAIPVGVCAIQDEPRPGCSLDKVPQPRMSPPCVPVLMRHGTARGWQGASPLAGCLPPVLRLFADLPVPCPQTSLSLPRPVPRRLKDGASDDVWVPNPPDNLRSKCIR